jgi:nucleotide-binding universal stress UspA family protein
VSSARETLRRRILVAYDGSAAAHAALLRVPALARPGDDVRVVNVMAEPGVGGRLDPPAGRARQAALLEDARRVLAWRGVAARGVRAVGGAATEILGAADRIGADLIVVGRRRGRRPRALGSVSGRLVRGARCDILVVHEDEPADEG